MKKNFKIVLIVIAIICLVVLFVYLFRGSISDMIIEKRMKKHNIPGVSYVLINDYSIKKTKCFGVANTQTNSVVDNATIFQAASSTKIIISAIVLHYVEEGMLNLEEDVNNYLKSWKIPLNDSLKNRKITLLHLLTHQSGLNLPEGGLNWENGNIPSLNNVLNGELPAMNTKAELNYIPGKGWEYSNFGYIVIQVLLEDILNKTLPEIVQEVVFEPLEMKNSTFNYPLSDEFKKNEALPHDNEGKQKNAILHPRAYAQGGLLTTSTDLAKFVIELMKSYKGQSNKILSQEMVEKMFEWRVDLDPNLLGGIRFGQAMGLSVKGIADKLVIFRAGINNPGATSWIVGYPNLGKGAVILTNSENGIDISVESMMIMGISNGWPNISE